MKNDEEQTGSCEQSRDPESVSALPASLCALLQEEWFLTMVFHHLVEYGLEDCRLVCRKWRDVCREFPVELAVKTQEQLEQAVTAFPNLVSLSVRDFEDEMKDTDFFSLLAAAPGLRTLNLDVDVLELTGHAQQSFRFVPQLTELHLQVFNVFVALDLLDSVRSLTGLTRLDILLTGWYPPPVEPFVELKEIRNLGISYSLLADTSGAHYFPSLTNLTSVKLVTALEVYPDAVRRMQVREFYFEVNLKRTSSCRL